MGSIPAIFEPAGATPKEEKGKRAAEDVNEFIRYFELNEIYYLEATSKLIGEIINKIRDAWFKYTACPSYKKIDYFVLDHELS